MKIKEPNIKYIGKVPVKLANVQGWIKTGRSLHLPENIVNNLVLDKENWTRYPSLEKKTPLVESPPVETTMGNKEDSISKKKKSKRR